jgi:predicted metal-dependent phosphoesterase TrpH
MPTIEFHCHTSFSKDSLTLPADLVAMARRKRIDQVVVTDHNSITGARVAQGIDSELIIIGEEIMTTQGEILAAFVQEEIPAYLSPQETIKQLKEQGAFISVSHPFDELRQGGWEEGDLLEILPFVDAIEVFNSRCMYPSFNRRAKEFAENHNVAGTVGPIRRSGRDAASHPKWYTAHEVVAALVPSDFQICIHHQEIKILTHKIRHDNLACSMPGSPLKADR